MSLLQHVLIAGFVSFCRGKEGRLLGLLLLLLLFCISLKFDPDGVPFRRCSEIGVPLLVGALLWASFHALVSFALSTNLSRKLESLYNRSDITKSRSLDAQHCEFLNRIVSLVHAILSFSFALVVLSKGFGIGLRNTELQSQLLMFSATYFVFDYGYVAYHSLGDILDKVHHVIAVGGLLSTLLLDQCGGEVVCAIVVTEVSNPFLHTRKLLQILQLHKRHPLFFKSNNYMFALSYLMGRMVFGGWFVYRTITSPDSPMMMKVQPPQRRLSFQSIEVL
jgi:hypothetical protein